MDTALLLTAAGYLYKAMRSTADVQQQRLVEVEYNRILCLYLDIVGPMMGVDELKHYIARLADRIKD